MTLQFNTQADINIPNGSRLVVVSGDEVKLAIIVDTKPNFAYYDKRLLQELSAGIINQLEYDTRFENVEIGRRVVELEDMTNTNAEVVAILDFYGLEDNSGDTLIDTLTNMNANNIQLIL